MPSILGDAAEAPRPVRGGLVGCKTKDAVQWRREEDSGQQAGEGKEALSLEPLEYQSTSTSTQHSDIRLISAGLKFVGYGLLFVGGAILIGAGTIADMLR